MGKRANGGPATFRAAAALSGRRTTYVIVVAWLVVIAAGDVRDARDTADGDVRGNRLRGGARRAARHDRRPLGAGDGAHARHRPWMWWPARLARRRDVQPAGEVAAAVGRFPAGPTAAGSLPAAAKR